MNDSVFNEQKVSFSVQMPQEIFDRMEALREREHFKISRSAYVVGLIEEGVMRLEAEDNA